MVVAGSSRDRIKVKNPGQPGDVARPQRTLVASADSFCAAGRRIIKSRTEIPDKVLEALDGKSAAAIIDPEQAKTFKIVSEVGELGKAGQIAVWTA